MRDAAATLQNARKALVDGQETRDRFFYLRYSFLHPLHLSCLGSLLLLTVVSGSPWVLLPAAVLETVVLGASRIPWVRRFVERRRRQQRRERAAHLRAALAVHMDPQHHGELRELEDRVAAARAHAASVGDSMESLLDDVIGLDRLLGTFIRLSVAHRVARESLAMTNRNDLSERIQQLRRYRDRSSSRRLRGLAERELALLERRLHCLEGNEEEVAAIARDLSSVASACRLVHERALSLVHPGDSPDDVERLVAQAQMHDEALGELEPSDDGTSSGRERPARVRADPAEAEEHVDEGQGEERAHEPSARRARVG